MQYKCQTLMHECFAGPATKAAPARKQCKSGGIGSRKSLGRYPEKLKPQRLDSTS